MRLTNSAYDTLKKIALVKYPAIVFFLFVLSCVVNIPGVKFVIGGFSLISLLIGVCLIVSTKRYDIRPPVYDGQIVVTAGDGKKRFSLELAGDPDDLEEKDSVTFKMVVEDEPSFED